MPDSIDPSSGYIGKSRSILDQALHHGLGNQSRHKQEVGFDVNLTPQVLRVNYVSRDTEGSMQVLL